MQIKGGEKLKAALDKIAQSVTKPATLQVGFLEGATYPDGKSVAMVAAIQNFGAPARGIPPRPFFSNMVKDKSPEWPEALGKVLVAKSYDATAALELIGQGIKGQLQQSVVDTNSPPLSPRTIARKGSSKPLIEHGVMLNAVDYKVD